MNLTITRHQRSLLLFLSAASYIAWFAGVGARIDARDIVATRVAPITIPRQLAVPNVSDEIKRDPFAGSPSDDDRGHDAPQQAVSANGERDDDVPDIADVPVADAAAGVSTRAEAPRTLVVRATIVGRRSVAYVADGSAMEIVRVGDSLGGRRIATIDLEGLAFVDGTRLNLLADYQATPKPKERLRELPARRAPSVTPASLATPIVAPTSTPTSAITPEPIRTVDSSGIPPGANPTPDLRDPTAFPNPYPYPARPPR